MISKPIIQVKNLKKHFGKIKAVDSISFDIYPGETLGLVGESGCGKSTLGKMLICLEEPTEGELLFEQNSIQNLNPKALKFLRRNIQMIFQDPYASLNPRMTAGNIVEEPLHIHKLEKKGRVEELFNLVGLNPNLMARFPHEFSGGQRQRIGIARALAVNPRFIICDEPVSALDVSVQAQIVNLLQKLQEQMGLTYLFITHDLKLVKYIAGRIAVMYLGHILELAPTGPLYSHPLHPYTQALLSAIPIPDPVKERKRQRIILKGEIPAPSNPPKGCIFSTRCPYAQALCHQERPAWKEHMPGHFAACHFPL